MADAMDVVFVPTNRPQRYAKAPASGADAIVLDIADVAASEL